MFGLGFKKNEEKDILIRTITELQELRAELSVLKERLFLIIPDQVQESSSEEMAAEAQGLAECCGDVLPAEMAAREEQPENISQEINISNENKAEETLLLHEDESGADPVAGEMPDPENALAKKEWAVVNFVEAKRPWWRLWGPKDHLVRRSI